MDLENLSKLQSLKKKMERESQKREKNAERLSADDFKALAKVLGVTGYKNHKIRVKKKGKQRSKIKKASKDAMHNDLHPEANLVKNTDHEGKQAVQIKKVQKSLRKDWIEARCTICRTSFKYLPEWRPIPVLCQGCKNERKNTAVGRRGGNSGGKTLFTTFSVFQGGSPGGGKRR
ncbi:hypothetical protein [Vreelandella stevensii]|uniref:hypothetical protein n=1 Tax=Vreelandella stevensii TaxID=502821 RepID=UPI00403B2E5D